MKYEKLFEKGKIGKLTLKNRIVMTPMGTGFAAASGEASEEITKFYEERSKGRRRPHHLRGVPVSMSCPALLSPASSARPT